MPMIDFPLRKESVMSDKESIDTSQARTALSAVEKMGKAGLKRALPPRWHDRGVALIVAVGFALYAQQSPGDFPALFIALGVVLFGAASRERIGAQSSWLPRSSSGKWALLGVSVFLVTLFFGGIYLRRAFDLAWVPLLTGAIAGATLWFLAENERRALTVDANRTSSE